jgi:hypothetical protein
VLHQGCPPAELTERLGVTSELWEVINAACSVRIVALTLEPGRGCVAGRGFAAGQSVNGKATSTIS